MFWTFLAEVIVGTGLVSIIALIASARERHRSAVARRHLANTLDGPVWSPSTTRLTGRCGSRERRWLRELLTAPLSRKLVIGYRLRIARVSSAMTDEEAILDIACMNEFLVDDGSAAPARVRPQRCLCLFTPERSVPFDAADLVRPPLQEIVDRCMIPASRPAPTAITQPAAFMVRG